MTRIVSRRVVTWVVFWGCDPDAGTLGQSEPQKNISKEGDRYLRTMLVQGAHYILGPFGEDSDLRRWGLKLAERGGKNAKKRAVVAVARKLAVLLHRLWVSGEVYEPLRNSQSDERSSLEFCRVAELDRRVRVTATKSWPNFRRRGEERSILR